MKHLQSLLLAALILTLLPFAQAHAQVASAAPNPVGMIVEIEGSAGIVSGTQQSALKAGSPIYLNDVVFTNDSSRAVIWLIDDTEITLSDNTQLRIDTYVFKGEEDPSNKGVYSILKGSFIYVSGLIANKAKPDVTIHTPVGSIGIRGTAFWGGEIDGEYGVLVEEGAVRLKTVAGEVLVNKGEGTSVRDRHSVPSAAKPWEPEKINRAINTVLLKREALILQRKLDFQAYQEEWQRALQKRLIDLKYKKQLQSLERQQRMIDQKNKKNP